MTSKQIAIRCEIIRRANVARATAKRVAAIRSRGPVAKKV